MATNNEQWKYEENQAVKNALASLEAIAGQKPGAYQSQYQPQIQNLTDQILNRGQFQYDLNGDALYNQYKDRYVGLGQQAMMDTMGQAAKLTGGYGNSYAQMAGQQAYHGYLQGLNDKVPELYQLALQRYNNEGQDLYSRYGLLSSQEEQAYNRFMNNYNMWNAERDWLAGRYDTERGFDYGGYRDAVADDQWQKEFDEAVRQFDKTHPTYSGSSGGGGGGRRPPDEEPKEELEKEPVGELDEIKQVDLGTRNGQQQMTSSINKEIDKMVKSGKITSAEAAELKRNNRLVK